jgi:glycosyltransferase involved in cell wall biosynthesis
MAIYIDISAAVHGRAGLGRYAESLARALVQKYPERFAFFYNQDRKVSPLAELESVPTRTVHAGYKPWRMVVWLGQFLGIGFERLVPEAELYHATEHLLLPLRRVPTVLTVHDLIYHLFPEHHKPLNYLFLNRAMPLFVQRAKAVIAVSESTRRDLIRYYGIPPDKITVIYEAAAPHFRPAPPEAIATVRVRYGLPEDFVLAVGTIEPRKNLSRLLEALQRLRQKGDNVRLVVVGSKGWLYEGFFRHLEELQLGDAVLLPGYVPDVDLPAVYSAAKVYVLPSLYEGFGLEVLEAMACGTAVACSRTSSLPEVGGEAAHYFDPTDVEEMAEAIATVWHNETLRAEMGRHGLAQAARFSWIRAAEETMAVYQRAMAL